MRLILEDVRFQHPGTDHPVLRGITCEIADGGTTAVVGPSGSGKTTLLALLGGLLSPQGGSFAAVDAETRHRPIDVATWVFQTVNLLSERTVLDNVCLGAYLDGASRDEARTRAYETLEQMGLSDHAQQPARLLSGGEAQRVGIARALASTRPLLLADEPTGQLDAATTEQVIDSMFASAHRTVLLVTHDDAVARRCDVVLRLDDGVLTERIEHG